MGDKNEKTYTDRLIHLWDAIESGKMPASLHTTRKVRELLGPAPPSSTGAVSS